jgi:predicted nucleotidyltransferase
MIVFEDRFPPSLRKSRAGLRACLDAFAETLTLERVILFGSHARNKARRDSDVDLCVVARGITSQHKAAVRLRQAIGTIRNKPALSLIPISPERLAEKKRAHDPFFQTVLNEGVCLAQED